MVTDINGFLEYRAAEDGRGPAWHTAQDLGSLYDGCSYDAFGCLFGVRDYANFRPLAAHRGLPADVSGSPGARYSQLTERHGDGGFHDASWITWAELKAIDWDEPAEKPDSRLHTYRRTPVGFRFTGKSTWSRAFAEAVGPRQGQVRLDPGEGQEWPEGSEWLIGDTLYRSVTLRRRDAFPHAEWRPVWHAMKTLAARHGDNAVRLVVWFDS
ncbi:hypothetical protein ACIQK9_09035 [Streptomyces hydrogenans]|uniref:hypothetical protein n=1 Tax=Streptomyces hydrogenans TaxID=1873719 RepID=UPI0038207C6E